MKRILEKKKLWFYGYIIIAVFGGIYGVLHDVLQQFIVFYSGGGQPVLGVFRALGVIVELLLLLYHFYRIFYLYRGTQDQGKWIAAAAVLLALNCLSFFDIYRPEVLLTYFVQMLLPFVRGILGIACVVHDYRIVNEE